MEEAAVAIQHMGEEDLVIEDPEEVVFTMKRIKTIENIDKDKIRSLDLISCMIESMEGLRGCKHLKRLDLYENRIKKIEGLEGMSELEFIELSYNQIKEIEGLDDCVNVETLRLASNKIEEIKCIDKLTKVHQLEVGSNKLRRCRNIDHLAPTLKTLWLGRNKITDCVLSDQPIVFDKLSILAFQCNRITSVDPRLFDQCPNLEELYLSENRIQTMPAEIGKLQNLKILDLCNNIMDNLDNVADLHNLEELWLSYNNISDLNEVKKLQKLQNLTCVYLEHNPIKDELGPGYRQAILDILPNLEQLDALMIQEKIHVKV